MYDPTNGFVTIVVLDDGETYSALHNCSICIVPFDQYQKVVNSGGDARDFAPIAEIGLCDISVPLDLQ